MSDVHASPAPSTWAPGAGAGACSSPWLAREHRCGCSHRPPLGPQLSSRPACACPAGPRERRTTIGAPSPAMRCSNCHCMLASPHALPLLGKPLTCPRPPTRHSNDTNEFIKQHEWLEQTYTAVYSKLTVEKVRPAVPCTAPLMPPHLHGGFGAPPRILWWRAMPCCFPRAAGGSGRPQPAHHLAGQRCLAGARAHD